MDISYKEIYYIVILAVIFILIVDIGIQINRIAKDIIHLKARVEVISDKQEGTINSLCNNISL